jgi:nucleotide-binding universal stress UspA family protein
MVILAPIDVEQEYERVLTVGQQLADAYDDELVVLYVMSEDEYESEREDRLSRTEYSEYPMSQAEADAAKRVERIAGEVLGDDADVHSRGRIGEPTPEILSVAEEVGARYIVLGGRKRTPTGKALFGSITQSVLLNADRPVVTVMHDRE